PESRYPGCPRDCASRRYGDRPCPGERWTSRGHRALAESRRNAGRTSTFLATTASCAARSACVRAVRDAVALPWHCPFSRTRAMLFPRLSPKTANCWLLRAWDIIPQRAYESWSAVRPVSKFQCRASDDRFASSQRRSAFGIDSRQRVSWRARRARSSCCSAAHKRVERRVRLQFVGGKTFCYSDKEPKPILHIMQLCMAD